MPIYLTYEKYFISTDIFNEGFWSELPSSTHNQELASLRERMKKTVLSSRATSTTTSYIRSLRKWKEFTEKHNVNYFPADPVYVALYLQHVAESTKSLQSVESTFYAIRWAHKLSGISSPTDNSTVQMVVEGAKRVIGTRKTNRKEPLKLEHLNGIIAKSNLENVVHLRNICMYTLAFSALLRFDDLIRIRRSDLQFNEGFLRIIITKSKNDQLREGNEVVISELPNPHSPVPLLKRYLSRLLIPENCTKFSFRPLLKSKGNHRLFNEDRHFSYTTFREQLKADLIDIVEDPSMFSTHSLRAGGATLAANTGLNDRIIQRHGRWKSMLSKNMYIGDDISKKLEVPKCLQIE